MHEDAQITEIDGWIIARLREVPGLSARDLAELATAAGFALTRRQVNRSLYANRAVFASEGSTPPRWRVLNLESVVGPQAGPQRSSTQPSTEKILRLPPLYVWQREALDAWNAQHHRGIVEAVTGSGKTNVGLAAASKALSLGYQVVIVVPTTELQRQWQEVLRPNCAGTLCVGLLGGGRVEALERVDVLIAVVNSLRSRAPNVDPARALVIADECHRYGSTWNAKCLDPGFAWRLGLSATYVRGDNGHVKYLLPFFGDVCFTMRYERALRERIIAPFRVALIGIDFATEAERLAYEDARGRASRHQWELVSRFDIPLEPFGQFLQLVQKLADGGHGRATRIARSFLHAFTEMRRILAESDAKFLALEALAQAIRDASGTIVFTQTIAGATAASQALARRGLSSAVVHSGLSPEERRSALKRFKTRDVCALIAPKVLDEGIDVPEADLAIIIAASKTRRQMIQRMGRVLRKKMDGRIARFAVLYVRETSEDPESGAHVDFLDEITDVAEQCRRFQIDTQPLACVEFLRPRSSQ